MCWTRMVVVVLPPLEMLWFYIFHRYQQLFSKFWFYKIIDKVGAGHAMLAKILILCLIYLKHFKSRQNSSKITITTCCLILRLYWFKFTLTGYAIYYSLSWKGKVSWEMYFFDNNFHQTDASYYACFLIICSHHGISLVENSRNISPDTCNLGLCLCVEFTMRMLYFKGIGKNEEVLSLQDREVQGILNLQHFI